MMNERIKELCEQATKWALDNYPPPVNPFMWEDLKNKKFAELIIKDCINLLGPEAYYGKNHIKEHFGVEK